MNNGFYTCWTDVDGRKHIAPSDQIMISIPGRPTTIGGGTNYDATIYFRDAVRDDAGSIDNYGHSDTNDVGSIFVMPTFPQAMRWLLDTGNDDTGKYTF